jgi:FixJ family two-component response regulator
VLRILTDAETPDWFLSARAATDEEDAEQKDVMVLTDKGEIGVQVKSGKSGYIEFKRKPENEMIALVMVKKRFEDKSILKEILKELEEIREAI